jgi:hypothetical protein
VNGRKDFQVRAIRASYRIRGRVPRTQIKREAKNTALTERVKSEYLEVKMAAENSLMAKILVYSAMKMRANGPLLYSVLNPETSSDSPSAKSNGVRLVSASIVTNQIKKTGTIASISQEVE